MNFIAFCSALNNTYLALQKDKEIFSEIIKSDENYHSLYLAKKIKEILSNNGLKPEELDFMAVNVGPGSFTGIRVALTIAKVMATELKIPLVDLDTANILLTAYDADLYISDARRDMYFIGTREKTDLIYKDKVDKVIKEYMPRKIVCDKRLSSTFKDAICYEDNELDLGRVMLKLAKDKYSGEKDKMAFSPILIRANYIQTPPVS